MSLDIWEDRHFQVRVSPSSPRTFEAEADDGFWLKVEKVRDGMVHPCWYRHNAKDITCIAPRGHDGPHIPATGILLAHTGPLVVTKMGSR